MCFGKIKLNFSFLFAYKYNRLYGLFHGIHILFFSLMEKSKLIFEYLSLIFSFSYCSLHTQKCTCTHMLAHTYEDFTAGQECKMNIIMHITFLICNYFLSIDFQKWFLCQVFSFLCSLYILQNWFQKWLYQLVTINFRKHNCH